MRVAIIGQGYVGLTIADGAAGAGHKVTGFDVNPDLVKALNSGVSHIEGISDAELKNFLSNKTYTASTETSSVNGCDVIVIAVPTPLTESREPDLSFVHAAVELIQNNVKTPTLIINESTSYPGTLRKEIAARITGVTHLYASSPERVDPGNTQWGTKNTPRLIGGLTPEAVAKIAVNALFNKKPEVITGFINKLGAFLVWLLPKKLAESTAASLYGL